MKRDQRSIHVNNCRRTELAAALERQSSKLKYCYCCFDWFVEEKWSKHCLTHLNPLTLLRCATITYCGTLFRPAFCLFCLGNAHLEAHRRFTSWTRHNKLFTHLQSHLNIINWPSSCPHPLSTEELGNEDLFLYHLKDAHDLSVPKSFHHQAQSRSNSEELFKWDHVVTLQKRKRSGQDQEAGLNRDPSCTRVTEPRQQLTGDQCALATSSPENPDPTWGINESGSSSNSKIYTTPSGIHQLSEAATETQTIAAHSLVGSEHISFQSLRSQSTSPPTLPLNNKSTDEGPSRTVDPRRICINLDEDYVSSLSDGLVNLDFAAEQLPENKKSRTILRLKPPKPPPKHKTVLRLSQPRKVSKCKAASKN